MARRQPPNPQPSPQETAKKLAEGNPHHHRLTDLGNAERFAEQHREHARWCGKWKEWVTFNGKCWEIDTDCLVDRFAKETVRSILLEAVGEGSDEIIVNLIKHALRSESNGAIGALLARAKSELIVQPDEFNTAPYILNFANGTVDLRTGEIHDFTPKDMLFHCLKTDYDPDAICPETDAWFEEMFNGDQTLIAYVWRKLGVSISGDTSAQEWFLGLGDGNNGKTTLTELMLELLEEYAYKAKAEAFITSSKDSNHVDKAEFYGKRFVTAAEIPMGSTLNEAMMKEIVGDKRINARRNYGHPFEYTMEASFWLVTNHKPSVRDMTDGFWRRVRFIPFLHRIPDDQVNPYFLEKKILPEAKGILARLVYECSEAYAERTVPIPTCVVEATADYKQENDLVERFWLAEIEEKQDAVVYCENVRKRFYRFCKEVDGITDENILASMLKKEMKRRGYKTRRSTGGYHVYDNILLKSADDFEADDDEPVDRYVVTQSYVDLESEAEKIIAETEESDVTLRNYVTSNQPEAISPLRDPEVQKALAGLAFDEEE